MVRRKQKLKRLIKGPVGDALCRVGKYLESRSAEELTDLGISALTAYAGWNAGKELHLDTSKKLGMAALGPMAYRLAKAPNLAASVAGVGILAAYGLVSVVPSVLVAPESVDDVEPWAQNIIDTIAPKDAVFGSATRFGGWLGVLLGKHLFGLDTSTVVPVPVVWPEGWYVHNIPEIAFYSARHTECGTLIETQSESALRSAMSIHTCPVEPPYVPPEPTPGPYIPPTPAPWEPPGPFIPPYEPPEPSPSPEEEWIIHKRAQGMYCATHVPCGQTICSDSEESRDLNIAMHSHEPAGE